MRSTPLILAVDDTQENLDILRLRLESQGYEVSTATDGCEALERVHELSPDLILLDIMMPRKDGIEVVRELKADAGLPFIPVILITAKADVRDVVEGLDAGGDDYLTKPFEHAALLARVRAMLRLKQLHDTVADQASSLERQALELAELNRTLEARVNSQVGEIARMQRLRRFLSPAVADAVLSADGTRDLLASHRAEVTVVFCDLRGFTAFAETAEPEEVMAVLRQYHEALGRLVMEFEGTLERFIGDGLLVIFNDPLPQPDHARRAVEMARRMRAAVRSLADIWCRAGHRLGFGVGVACGYATIGGVGFDDRIDYSVIGTIPNLAARLCGEAGNGQILVNARVAAAFGDDDGIIPMGELSLKGFHRPMPAYSVVLNDG